MTTISITDGTVKARYKNLVIYDIDYLLKNFSREAYLLESYKRQPHVLSFDEVIKDEDDKQQN